MQVRLGGYSLAGGKLYEEYWIRLDQEEKFMPEKHDKSEHERIVDLERQMEKVAGTVASLSESFGEIAQSLEAVRARGGAPSYQVHLSHIPSPPLVLTPQRDREEDPISELAWRVNALGIVLRHADFRQQGIITQFKLRNIERRNIAEAISSYADIMLRPPPTGFDPDEDPCQMFRQGKGRWAMPYCDGKCDGGGACNKVEIRTRTSTASDVYDIEVKCVCQ